MTNSGLDFTPDDSSDDTNSNESPCPVCSDRINHRGATGHLRTHGVDAEHVKVDPQKGISLTDRGWEQVKSGDSDTQSAEQNDTDDLPEVDTSDLINPEDAPAEIRNEVREMRNKTILARQRAKQEQAERKTVSNDNNNTTSEQAKKLENRIDTLEHQRSDFRDLLTLLFGSEDTDISVYAEKVESGSMEPWLLRIPQTGELLDLKGEIEKLEQRLNAQQHSTKELRKQVANLRERIEEVEKRQKTILKTMADDDNAAFPAINQLRPLQ